LGCISCQKKFSSQTFRLWSLEIITCIPNTHRSTLPPRRGLSSQGSRLTRCHPGTCSKAQIPTPAHGAAPSPAEPNTPHLLVSPWGTLPGVLGLPSQPQGLGPAEGGRRADLLLLVAVDPLQDGLLGFQRLGLRLRLRRHGCNDSSVSTTRLWRTRIRSPTQTGHSSPHHATQRAKPLHAAHAPSPNQDQPQKRPTELNFPPSSKETDLPLHQRTGGALGPSPSPSSPTDPEGPSAEMAVHPLSDTGAGPAGAGLSRHLHVPTAQHRRAALPHPTAHPGPPHTASTRTPRDAPARPHATPQTPPPRDLTLLLRLGRHLGQAEAERGLPLRTARVYSPKSRESSRPTLAAPAGSGSESTLVHSRMRMSSTTPRGASWEL